MKAVVYKDNLVDVERVLFKHSESLKKLIIDFGATKSVVGTKWFRDFLVLLPHKTKGNLRYKRENRHLTTFCDGKSELASIWAMEVAKFSTKWLLYQHVHISANFYSIITKFLL